MSVAQLLEKENKNLKEKKKSLSGEYLEKMVLKQCWVQKQLLEGF